MDDHFSFHGYRVLYVIDEVSVYELSMAFLVQQHSIYFSPILYRMTYPFYRRYLLEMYRTRAAHSFQTYQV